MTKKIVTTAILTATLLLAMSCLNDNFSACLRGVKLHFSYILADGDDALLTKVKDIRVYGFDENGVLVGIFKIDPATLVSGTKNIDVAPGKYTFVVWGGSSKNLLESDYLEASMINNDLWEKPVIIGQTTLEEFRVMLRTKKTSAGLAPENDNFDDLFYASAEKVVVLNTSQILSVDLNFIENSKIIGVIIEGLSYIQSTRVPSADEPLKIFVAAANGRYNYENLIDANAPIVRYEPPYKTLTTEKIVVDIKTLKLDIEHSQHNPVLLYIQNRNGDNLISPIKVVEAIMKIRDSNNNLIYTKQEDIDKEKRFDFTFSINLNLTVTISINNFVIENLSPELE